MYRRRPPQSVIQPSPEGRWGPMLAAAIFIAFLLLGALIGVGIWRYWVESRDRSDKLRDVRRLTEDIEDLIDIVRNITVATNCTVFIGNMTRPNQYPDSEFRIFDDLDPTAQMRFNDNLIPTATTQLLVIQNVSGTIAYIDDVLGQSSVFQDDTFAVQNVIDNTREVMLDVSGVSAGVTQTMTIQNGDGTIAYLADIPIFPSTFLDDAFAVVNFLDNTRIVMFNNDLIDPATSIVMTIQDRDGTIAYLSNLANGTGPPFPDDAFEVFSQGTPTATTMLDLSGVSTATTIVMTVQDRDGIIAYLSNIVQVIEVLVTSDRIFPSVGFEGVGTLSGLGFLTHMEITLCGGGGGACEVGDEGHGSGGGGSMVENFVIHTPNSKFDNFNCTVGRGGSPCNGTQADMDGTDTSVIGISTTGFFLELTGYGGGGAMRGLLSVRDGGSGGGSGGSAVDNTPGNAGDLGGVVGTRGGFLPGFCPNGSMGTPLFKFPWRAGLGGNRGFSPCPRTNGVQGGFDFSLASGSFGAPSLFGSPAFVGSTPPCAGATPLLPLTGDGRAGGRGQIVFRYYVQ